MKLDTAIFILNIVFSLTVCHSISSGELEALHPTAAALGVLNAARLIGGVVDYFTGLFSD